MSGSMNRSTSVFIFSKSETVREVEDVSWHTDRERVGTTETQLSTKNCPDNERGSTVYEKESIDIDSIPRIFHSRAYLCP